MRRLAVVLALLALAVPAVGKKRKKRPPPPPPPAWGTAASWTYVGTVDVTDGKKVTSTPLTWTSTVGRTYDRGDVGLHFVSVNGSLLDLVADPPTATWWALASVDMGARRLYLFPATNESLRMLDMVMEPRLHAGLFVDTGRKPGDTFCDDEQAHTGCWTLDAVGTYAGHAEWTVEQTSGTTKIVLRFADGVGLTGAEITQPARHVKVDLK